MTSTCFTRSGFPRSSAVRRRSAGEAHGDGRRDYTDGSTSTGATMLDLVPLPDVADVPARHEFHPCLTTFGEFERAWVLATKPPPR